MLGCVFHIETFGNEQKFSGFSISGHAGYGEEGNDVICAAVSSCTMLVCNAVTENFGADAQVEVGKDKITLTLKKPSDPAQKLISAFYEHLEILSQDHTNIRLSIV